MYTIEIYNVEWLQFSPIISDAALQRLQDKDSIIRRDSLEGTLEFRGTDFDTLLSLRDSIELSLRVKYNGTVKLTGKINLLGEWNEKEKTCKLNYIIFDQYTDILNNLDAEISIRELQNVPVSHQYNSEINTINVAQSFPEPEY